MSPGPAPDDVLDFSPHLALALLEQPACVASVWPAFEDLRSAAHSVKTARLRLVISAGEALPAELYSRWKQRTGVEILDGIGSAEMFHIFITNRLDDVKLGSLGRAVEGYEAKVCDDAGRELPRGEVGTL